MTPMPEGRVIDAHTHPMLGGDDQMVGGYRVCPGTVLS
jgi:hypothetical protein